MATIESSHNSSVNASLCLEVLVVKTIIHSTNIFLILPLSLLVLSLGFHQRQRKKTVPISHCDFFTYNLAVMELISVLGSAIDLFGSLFHTDVKIGLFVRAFPWSGQILFPMFICMDRYLAVVHPITYMRLKQSTGMQIRNISIGVVWILCCLGIAFIVLVERTPESQFKLDVYNGIMFFSLMIIVTFCCLSVLCVLIGPRPGEVPRDRQRADRSKQKAFNIILIIMVVLYIRFGGSMFYSVISTFPTVDLTSKCNMITATVTMWFDLPSSLVLPLLYLHRAWTLQHRKHNTGSG